MAQWKEIQTIQEWEQILLASGNKPALIFKHSTRCPISADAWKEYQACVDTAEQNDMDFILVKVIQFRDVSNQIEHDLKVKHESPQAILIRNQGAVWHANHRKITKQQLESAIEN